MATANELSISDILEVIERLGWVGPARIAWELAVATSAIEPLWHQAVGEGLIRMPGSDPRDRLFSQLTSRGRRRLHASRGEPWGVTNRGLVATTTTRGR